MIRAPYLFGALLTCSVAFGADLNQVERDLYSESFQVHRSAFLKLRELSRKKGEGSQSAQKHLADYRHECERFFESLGTQFPPTSYVMIETDNDIPLARFKYIFLAAHVEILAIKAKSFSDAHLKMISGFDSLEILELDSCNISGSCLDKLSLPNLVVLRLSNLKLDDVNFNGTQFPKLEKLDIHKTNASNKVLSEVELPRLKTLQIEGSKIDKKGVLAIAKFPSLNELSIDYAMFSEELGSAIRKSKLTELRISKPAKETISSDAIRKSIGEKCILKVVE